MWYDKDVAMAASPLNGPVVLVRSGRVCERPAGPLFVRVSRTNSQIISVKVSLSFPCRGNPWEEGR